jgi:hypothetical protein
MATVTVDGENIVSTDALATRPLSSPSLGWRLLHLL